MVFVREWTARWICEFVKLLCCLQRRRPRGGGCDQKDEKQKEELAEFRLYPLGKSWLKFTRV